LFYLDCVGERQEKANLDAGPDALVVELTVGPNEAVGRVLALSFGLRKVEGHGRRLEAKLQHSAVLFTRMQRQTFLKKNQEEL